MNARSASRPTVSAPAPSAAEARAISRRKNRFHDAVIANDVETARKLLPTIDPAWTDRRRDVHTPENALFLAAQRGFVEMTELLLPIFDARQPNIHGQTALMVAAERRAPGTVRLLLPHSDLEARDCFGNTVLALIANHDGNDEVFEMLVSHCYVHFRDEHGSTPLHSATRICSKRKIQALLNAGADVNAARAHEPGSVMKDGLTPLRAAKSKWQESHHPLATAALALLLPHADPLSQDTHELLTPLMWAVIIGSVEAVKALAPRSDMAQQSVLRHIRETAFEKAEKMAAAADARPEALRVLDVLCGFVDPGLAEWTAHDFGPEKLPEQFARMEARALAAVVSAAQPQPGLPTDTAPRPSTVRPPRTL